MHSNCGDFRFSALDPLKALRAQNDMIRGSPIVVNPAEAPAYSTPTGRILTSRKEDLVPSRMAPAAPGSILNSLPLPKSPPKINPEDADTHDDYHDFPSGYTKAGTPESEDSERTPRKGSPDSRSWVVNGQGSKEEQKAPTKLDSSDKSQQPPYTDQSLNPMNGESTHADQNSPEDVYATWDQGRNFDATKPGQAVQKKMHCHRLLK